MPRPVTVLFTVPNFITAGSGLALLHVARRLDRDQFEPAICVLRRGGALESTVEELGIPLYELPFAIAARPLHRLGWNLWRSASRFEGIGARLWHSYHYLDDYTEPLIARLAGAEAWIYTKKNMSWGSRAWRLRSRLASGIGVQNPELIERCFASKALRRRARLIPPGVDTELYRPAHERRLELRKRLGLGARDRLVGSVAQVIPRKDIGTIVKAIAPIEGAHLAVAGALVDPDHHAELRALAAALGASGRVHFFGPVSDIPAFHAELDLFVLASHSEGCPVALLEAMSCGVASIVTDIPGSRLAVENGRSGLVVPVADPESLSRAIRALLDSRERRAELAAAARRRIESDYAIEIEVRRYQDLYREALEEGAIGRLRRRQPFFAH